MGKVKELNVKNRTYYYFSDIINIKYFHSNLLKIDKNQYKDIDIYYIGYITVKEISDCENINSINPLYLMIHSVTQDILKKSMVKNTQFLIQQKNMMKFFLGLKKKLKRLMVEKS